MVFGSLRRRHV